MNRYEARSLVDRIQRLLEVHANRTVSRDDRFGNAPTLREAGVDLGKTERVKDGDREEERLTDAQARDVARLLVELEEEAAGLLENADDLYIIRQDGAGPSSEPTQITYNTLAKVESVEVQDGEKIIEWPDGRLQKVPTRSYLAWSEEYEAEDGRKVRDSCRSGPEGFLRSGGEVQQYGAASALLARLLEAHAAGAV